MNVNSKQKTLNNNQWIRDAAEQLAEIGIPTAKLDAEIILAHTLRKNRTWLHAHGDEPLDARQLEIAGARLGLRLDRVPIAYIIGHKEFYGRLFNVTPAVLTPRPESETCIELLKQLLPASAHNLIDVGTGSGCLGITAKLELPHLAVTLSDISSHALTVAHNNAQSLAADVSFLQSNLLSKVTGQFDCILANLPYVDVEWERSPETNHEPGLALFAGDGGTELIRLLLDQAVDVLTPSGYLFIEADPAQHSALLDDATAKGFRVLRQEDYYLVLTR